jgi:hypothetical protein
VEMCRGTTIGILLYEKGDIRAVRSADRCVRTERWKPRFSGCVTCEKRCYTMSIRVFPTLCYVVYSQTGLNPLVASLPGNLNLSSLVS